MTGHAVWTAVDGLSRATPGVAGSGGMTALAQTPITRSQAFLGQIQGSMGESSRPDCLLGAVFLIYTGIASWRIMAGTPLGMVGTVLLFNPFGRQPMADVPWYWRLVLGDYAVGLVFMATDPVSAAMTNPGR